MILNYIYNLSLTDIIVLGKGECVIHGKEDCNNDGTAQCECKKATTDDNSTYSGSKCQCCDSGDCKEECFDRFSSNANRGECFGRGNCKCDLADETHESGTKCKVNLR